MFIVIITSRNAALFGTCDDKRVNDLLSGTMTHHPAPHEMHSILVDQLRKLVSFSFLLLTLLLSCLQESSVSMSDAYWNALIIVVCFICERDVRQYDN